jgi:hypothetical protein
MSKSEILEILQDALYNDNDYDMREAIKFAIEYFEQPDTLRWWKSGENPPDGWYAVMFPAGSYPNYMLYLEDMETVGSGINLYTVFMYGGVLYGPIPEPESRE